MKVNNLTAIFILGLIAGIFIASVRPESTQESIVIKVPEQFGMARPDIKFRVEDR